MKVKAMWNIKFVNQAAEDEVLSLSADLKAKFIHVTELLVKFGPQNVGSTGSAATPLAALLLSLTKDSEQRYDIAQGVEMGRPSLLICSARRTTDGIRASVGGGCVPVLKGEVSL